jgi:choline dehydrogenase
MRKVVAQKAFDRFRGREVSPGPDATSDEAILAWLRRTGATTFHPASTCRMGTDENSVVDAALKVRGVARLRVADASVMPFVVSGNTNAPTIMIGEKAADLVKSAWR